MTIFQGALFLFFGMGLLIMDWRSLKSGWLSCGPNGLKGRLEFKRAEQPLGYWVMFILYGFGGAWLVIFSLRLLVGLTEPLQLE